MDRRKDKITKLVFEDLASINSSVPSKRVMLKKALEGERLVPLKDGGEHLMDLEELEELSSSLPSWMKWVVRVPLLLAYEPQNGVIKVLGSEWDEKAIRIVLGLERDEPIRMYHLEKLIMRFSTLVFIIFEVDMSRVLRGDIYE